MAQLSSLQRWLGVRHPQQRGRTKPCPSLTSFPASDLKLHHKHSPTSSHPPLSDRLSPKMDCGFLQESIDVERDQPYGHTSGRRLSISGRIWGIPVTNIRVPGSCCRILFSESRRLARYSVVHSSVDTYERALCGRGNLQHH